MDDYGPLGDKIAPVEIRPGVFIHIFGLPHDLTHMEAQKLAAVVQALASGPPSHGGRG